MQVDSIFWLKFHILVEKQSYFRKKYLQCTIYAIYKFLPNFQFLPIIANLCQCQSCYFDNFCQFMPIYANLMPIYANADLAILKSWGWKQQDWHKQVAPPPNVKGQQLLIFFDILGHDFLIYSESQARLLNQLECLGWIAYKGLLIKNECNMRQLGLYSAHV